MMWKQLAILLAIQLCFGCASQNIRGVVKTVGGDVSLSSTDEKTTLKSSTIPERQTRISSKPPSISIDAEAEVDLPASDRQLARRAAVVLNIVNDCGLNVNMGLNFTTPRGTNKLQWSIVQNGAKLTVSYQPFQSTVYVYGTNSVGFPVYKGSSDMCITGISGKQCFRKVVFPKRAAGPITYKPCSETVQLTTNGTWSTLLGVAGPPAPAPTRRPVAPPTPPPLQASESGIVSEWLNAHNSRRTRVFQQYGLSPKNLRWSPGLAASAQAYAEKLATIPGCVIQHGYQGDHYGGENLACNFGAYNFESLTPEEVMQLWFDGEAGKPFMSNLHYYQVAWRGSSYVGCGVASKNTADGGKCFIQACRYIATGNCNVDANNILSQSLQDTSPCLPLCPPENPNC